jgi:hypothetical protein
VSNRIPVIRNPESTRKTSGAKIPTMPEKWTGSAASVGQDRAASMVKW